MEVLKHSRIVIPSYDSVPTPSPFKPLRRKENLFFIGFLLFCFLLVWEMRPGPPVLSTCSATELPPFLSKIWVAVCYYSCKSYHICKIHVAVIIHRSATQVASSSFPGIAQLCAFRFYCAHFSHPHIWMLSTRWTAPLSLQRARFLTTLSIQLQHVEPCKVTEDSGPLTLTACRASSLEQWVPRSLKDPETHSTAHSSHLELVRFVLSAWAHFGFRL